MKTCGYCGSDEHTNHCGVCGRGIGATCPECNPQPAPPAPTTWPSLDGIDRGWDPEDGWWVNEDGHRVEPVNGIIQYINKPRRWVPAPASTPLAHDLPHGPLGSYGEFLKDVYPKQ